MVSVISFLSISFCPLRASYLFSCSGHMPFDLWTLPYSLRVFWVLDVLLCLPGHLETLLLHLQGLFPQQHEVLLRVYSQHSFRDTACLGLSFSVLYFLSFLCLLNFYHLTSHSIHHSDTRHREHAQSCPLLPTVSQCPCLPCVCVILTITCLFALLLNFSFLLYVLVECHTEPEVIIPPGNGLPFLPLLVWDFTLSHWQSFKDLLGHWAVNQGQCGTWEHKPEAFSTLHDFCSPSY